MNKHLLRILLLFGVLFCSIYFIPVPYTISGSPTISAYITRITFGTRPTGSEIQQNTLKISVSIWNKSPTFRSLTFTDNSPILVQLSSPDPLLNYYIVKNDTHYYLSAPPGSISTTLSVELVFSQIIFGGVAPYGIYTFEVNLCLTRELLQTALCSVKISNEPITIVFMQNQTEFDFPLSDNHWGQVTPQFTIHELLTICFMILVYRPLKLWKITRKEGKISLYPTDLYDK